MTKFEFLDKLKVSLSNDFASADVQGQIAYYSDYIESEIAKGRSEADVIAELGDPWVIARSLVNAGAEQMGGYEDYGTDGYTSYSNRTQYEEDAGYEDEKISPVKRYLFEHPRALTALVIVGLLLVVCVIFSVLMGIFNLVAPVLVPVMIIVFVIRLIRGDGRRGRWI